MRNNSCFMALGGITAALAVTIMCMGTLIPFATYICPVICAVILQCVLFVCKEKIAWVWYSAVAILSILMAPDKEAAAVFLFLGYYPILKPKFEKFGFHIPVKILFFNIASLLTYGLLIWFMGMYELLSDFREAGIFLAAVTLILGNVTFLLFDKLLSRIGLRR